MSTLRAKLPKAAKKKYDKKLKKVFHEFKVGKLKAFHGGVVSNRSQAIAIALSEGKGVVKSFMRRTKSGRMVRVSSHKRK